MRVHNIKDELLLNASTFKEIADDFLFFIKGATISTYNSKFNLGFIQMELDRAGKNVSLKSELYSNCLMRDVANGGRWISLDRSCRKYHTDISLRKVHSALVDTFLAAELYIKFHNKDFFPHYRLPQRREHRPCRYVVCPKMTTHRDKLPLKPHLITPSGKSLICLNSITLEEKAYEFFNKILHSLY